MNEITVIPQKNMPEIMDKANKYLDSIGNNLSPVLRTQFIEICTSFGLNPFIKEVYGIPYQTKDGEKLSIIVGYEVYLKRAETSGQLSGWRAWTEGSFELVEVKKTMKKKDGGTWDKVVRVPRGDLKGCVEITRKDWDKPFYHEVYIEEYAQDNEMWGDKPRTMIKKVAIAQGFRMAFPVELGGMPCTQDEMPQVVDVTPMRETQPVITHAPDTPKREPISRQQGGEIDATLKAVGISQAEFFAAMNIKRYGELFTDEMTKINTWVDSRTATTTTESEPVLEPELTPEPTTELF